MGDKDKKIGNLLTGILYYLLFCLNIYVIYVLYKEIEAVRQGDLKDVIRPDSPSWKYTSEEAYITGNTIYMAIFTVFLLAAIFFLYKKDISKAKKSLLWVWCISIILYDIVEYVFDSLK